MGFFRIFLSLDAIEPTQEQAKAVTQMAKAVVQLKRGLDIGLLNAFKYPSAILVRRPEEAEKEAELYQQLSQEPQSALWRAEERFKNAVAAVKQAGLTSYAALDAVISYLGDQKMAAYFSKHPDVKGLSKNDKKAYLTSRKEQIRLFKERVRANAQSKDKAEPSKEELKKRWRQMQERKKLRVEGRWFRLIMLGEELAERT